MQYVKQNFPKLNLVKTSFVIYIMLRRVEEPPAPAYARLFHVSQVKDSEILTGDDFKSLYVAFATTPN
jgi:hypothetical protein